MLILTRSIGQTIKIGGEITVAVVGVQGNQVRIGVSAPREMRVDREEVRARIEREDRHSGH
ncbi:MAG: carbon storage regulator CsrA [Pseudomonadales bacterium]|nr:carbon storage regulator CsrA [Pseudomonadales bacterium]